MAGARRVLLVNPVPLYGGTRMAGAPAMPPSLVSLFSFLVAHGVPVEVLDLHVELGSPRTLENVSQVAVRSCELVLQHDFDLLAMSCNSSFQYLGAVDLAQRVRAADSSVRIVVGGCHVSAVPEDFLGAEAPFNYVVTGEGELALLDLAQRQRRTVRSGLVAGVPLPLDQVYLDLASYPYLPSRPHWVQFPLSRGCPYRCAFCAGTDRGGWRAYPPEQAFDVLRRLLAVRPEVVGFCDPCFGLRRPWRRAVLGRLTELKPHVPMVWETRVDALDHADLELVARMEVRLELGVETMSPRMAEVMGKARNGAAYVRRSRTLLDELHRHRVLTQVYLLVNHPGEDAESLRATVDYFTAFASSHPHTTVFATPHAFMYFPGTGVADSVERLAEEFGTRIGHPQWWHEAAFQGPLADDVRASHDELDADAAVDELLRQRTATVMGMPIEYKLLWRRLRAPLRAMFGTGGEFAESASIPD
jgi:B12 binding domain/Radical SAM superfamily